MNQECFIELNSTITNQQRKAFLKDESFDLAAGTPTTLINRQKKEIQGNASLEEEFKAPTVDPKESHKSGSLAYLEDSLVSSQEDLMVQPSMNFHLRSNRGNNDSHAHSDVRLNIQDSRIQSFEISGGSTQIDYNSRSRGRQDPDSNPNQNNNQGAPVSQNINVQNRPWTIVDEAKNILRTVFEIYSFIIVMYALSILVLKKELSFYYLFFFTSAFCFLQAVRNLRPTGQESTMTRRQRRSKYFKVMDWSILGSFLLLSGFRVQLIQILLSPFVSLGFLNTVLFYLFSDLHNSLVKTRTVALYKLIFWSQVLLISLKADGLIDNWAFVFVALFYTLVFFMSVSVGFFILAFSYVCQSCHLDGFDYNIVGLIWDFLNALYSWVWGFALLGLIEELKNQGGSSILVPGLTAGLVHSSVLMLFTIVLRSNLTSYLISTLQLIVNVEETEIVTHSFETIQGNIPYLLKVSPTYYMVINKDFKVRDKQHTEGCKKQIKEVKRQKKQSKGPNKRVNVKLNLDKNAMPEISLEKTVPEHKSATIKLESRTFKLGKPGEASDNTPGFKDLKSPDLCYSDDDAEVLDQVQQKAEKSQNPEENDHSCVVCCMNAPNAVFMKCGHGGICYGCALETWKNGDKCFLCRQPIDEILKVSLVNRVNVAKVIEGTKKNPTITSLEEITG